MAELNIRGQITFLYFDDLAGACRFFEKTLGLPLAVDQGWTKIYRSAPTSYLGAVDRSRGACPATARDGVLTSLVVTDFDEMARRLGAEGIRFVSGPALIESLQIKSMMFFGPEGYKFEVE